MSERRDGLFYDPDETDEERLAQARVSLRAKASGCEICRNRPEETADATAYVQHCMDSGHHIGYGEIDE